ncbi:MAG: GTP cyclohydrolase IIa [Candidatus Hadarchaeales archaeon]
MRKIQITVIQVDCYGPWTVTPSPKPESELQILQSRLYADLQEKFSSLGGLVFQARQDNMLAISNGLTMDDHRRIQMEIVERFPVTVSMGVGCAEKPYDAQVAATLALQSTGSSRNPDRKSKLAGTTVVPPDEDWVEIVHMDVNHSTLLTDTKPIYETQLLINEILTFLMKRMLRHGGMVFYMGGDNFMAVSNGIDEKVLIEILKDLKLELGVEMKAGLGKARRAANAAKLASQALHEIRSGKSRTNIIVKCED